MSLFGARRVFRRRKDGTPCLWSVVCMSCARYFVGNAQALDIVERVHRCWVVRLDSD